MQATLEHIGHDVVCRAPDATPAECRLDGEILQPALLALATRYDHAVRNDKSRGNDDALPALGRELWSLIDATGWATAWAATAGPRSLEIRVANPAEPLAAALLDAPWELLATAAGFLADDALQLFELTRRIGSPATPMAPRHADLQLMFMAAAPTGADELDFEAEESAILQATQGLPLHLVVEESGALQPLAERLALNGPFEAVHLSCHGNIDPKRGPFLALEDVQGGMQPAFARDVAQLLGNADATPLLFLSACRTAEQATDEADPARSTEPFVRNLVRAGVHNVLGWDGSVYDTDAVAFATTFYRELALFARIPRAAALARQQLRQRNLEDVREGRHWHLARLYLGVQGGGSLAAKGPDKRKLASTRHANQFLDAQRSEVPVASRLAFVGRRRPIQAVMRAFATGSVGVLVHGMGNLGKSSLAQRVATRMTGHKTVVVFKQYDALGIIDRLLDAVPPLRQSEYIIWRNRVADNPALLANVVEALLDGPFDAQPILLVIDDLEGILETPSASATAATTPVRTPWRTPLAAVLSAFARVNTLSRLLITSRYTFSLPDARGRDLATALTSVPLRPMGPRERIKQMRALVAENTLSQIDRLLAQRALAAADGNPGLQATLMTPLLAGENAAAEQAITVIEGFQHSGVAPESLEALMAQGVAQHQGNALLAFFRRMAFDVYRAALTPAQARMLAIACVIESGLPIPWNALNVAGTALAVPTPPLALQRLLALGLLDDWGVINGQAAVSANPLARPLVSPLQIDDTQRAATAAVPVLANAWVDHDGDIAHDARGVELARLALLAPHSDPAVLDRAAISAASHLFRSRDEGHRALHDVLQPTLARLAGQAHPPSAALACIAFDCANRLGDMNTRQTALESLAITVREEKDDMVAGRSLVRLAEASENEGRIDDAKRHLQNAVKRFRAVDSVHDLVITMGRIADILQAHGQLDEALRIRQEEQLPVYERLHEVREKAITMCQIADILKVRGQLDEALRIYEEQLSVFDHLCKVQDKAVTMGKIADILKKRGQYDEALRIYKEQLPIHERLHDVRDKAVTMGNIADILQACGQLDEALHIYEKQLLIYESLPGVREKAIAMGRIATILHANGQLDEALRIHEARLSTFVQLSDVAGITHAKFSIARLLLERGDRERGGIQPIYDNLTEAFAISVDAGLADGIGHIGILLANVMAADGLIDEALAVLGQAETANSALGQPGGLEQVRRLRQQIQALRPAT